MCVCATNLKLVKLSELIVVELQYFTVGWIPCGRKFLYYTKYMAMVRSGSVGVRVASSRLLVKSLFVSLIKTLYPLLSTGSI